MCKYGHQLMVTIGRSYEENIPSKMQVKIMFLVAMKAFRNVDSINSPDLVTNISVACCTKAFDFAALMLETASHIV